MRSIILKSPIDYKELTISQLYYYDGGFIGLSCTANIFKYFQDSSKFNDNSSSDSGSF